MCLVALAILMSSCFRSEGLVLSAPVFPDITSMCLVVVCNQVQVLLVSSVYELYIATTTVE